MAAHERRLGAEAADVAEQRLSVPRVALDDVELVLRERPRLAQDRVRHLQLADVVQQRGDGEAPHRPPRSPRSWPTWTASSATLRVCSRVEASLLARRSSRRATHAPSRASSRVTTLRTSMPERSDCEGVARTRSLPSAAAMTRNAPSSRKCPLQKPTDQTGLSR